MKRKQFEKKSAQAIEYRNFLFEVGGSQVDILFQSHLVSQNVGNFYFHPKKFFFLVMCLQMHEIMFSKSEDFHHAFSLLREFG